MISFEHNPSGIFIEHECFNCNLTIDYAFCEVYLDDEIVGSLCVRCVGKIEEDIEKYLKEPYNKDYKNIPSIEKFYRANLTLDAVMQGVEDVEKYIIENLPSCYQRNLRHISALNEESPLHENQL